LQAYRQIVPDDDVVDQMVVVSSKGKVETQ